MTEEKYKVELSTDEMQKIIDVIGFASEKLRPFVPMTLINIEDKLRKIILYGCFKHNRLGVRFDTGPQSSVIICPQCDPKEYQKLKRQYKEEQI